MRRRLASVLGSLGLVITAVVASVEPPVVSASEANRTGGADRYETAVQVARRVGGGNLSNLDRLLVVTGENFPDALAASGLAGYFDRCPSGTGVCGRTAIVLTRTASLPAATRNAIRTSALSTSRIIVLGGPDAISQQVHDEIAAAAGWSGTGENPVLRIAGATRYETATAIVDHVREVAGGSLPASYRTVLVANGETFPDALAAGSLAYANGHLLLLSRAPSAPDTTVGAVEDLRANCAILIGGTAALSSRVSTQVNTVLTPGGCGVDRIGGADRYETAANIATRFVALNGPGTSVLLTSGENFADALTMGPLSRSDTPVILTATDTLPAATQEWLRDNPSNAANIDVIGGPDSVPPAVVNAAVLVVPPRRPASPPSPAPDPLPVGVSGWPTSVTSQGGGDGLTITGTAATTSGESFVTGRFSDTAIFTGAITGATLTSAGATDGFVAKVSATGTWEWAAHISGTQAISANSITTTTNGAIVTGVFAGTATFGSTSLVSSGGIDVFVARISDTGEWLWVAAAGAGVEVDANDRAYSVSVDATGSAFVVGHRSGSSAAFVLKHADGTSLNAGQVTDSPKRAPFVAKIDANGVWQWARVVDMSNPEGDSEAYGVSVSHDGTAIVTGSFRNTATFTGATTGSTLTSVDSLDAFVAKIDASGAWVWATTLGGPSIQRGRAVAATSDGGAFFTGGIQDTVTIAAPNTVSNAAVTLSGTGGNNDIVVGRLDTNGLWVWATRVESSGNDFGTGIDAVSDGSGAIVTGFYHGMATFSATSTFVLTSAGGSDLFVASISASGAWGWVVPGGSAGNDEGFGVSVLGDGSAIVGGFVTGIADFGEVTVAGLDNRSGAVARVTPSGSFTWATEATAPGSIVGNGITGAATATLSDGSVLAVGVVNQTATFTNTATGNPITAASLGAGDVYVAKLTADGRYVWVTLAGGLGNDQATGISALADGSGAIVTGSFQGTASFAGAITGSALTSVGNADMFAAKIDANGNWQWAVPAGGEGDQIATGVAAFPDGSGAMVTGYTATVAATNGTMTFEGATTVSNAAITLSNNSGTDGFVARVNGEGLWEWARSIGNTGGTDLPASVSQGNGISVIVDGGVTTGAVVTGTFNNTATFGGLTLANAVDLDAFVARIDLDGTWVWATRLGDASRERGRAVSAAVDGGAFFTGSLQATVTIPAGDTSGGQAITLSGTSGNNDIVVGRLDSAGKWVWATRVGGAGGDFGNGVAGLSDGSGAIVTGEFTGTVTFPTATPTSLTSTGDSDAFVAKIAANGAWQWARAAGGVGSDRGNAVAAFTDGASVITGNYVGTVTVGAYVRSGLSNTSALFAKVGADGSFIGSDPDPGVVDPGFNVVLTGGVATPVHVWAIAVQSDGKAIIGGSFTAVDGLTQHRYVARMNADGTLDTSFTVANIPGIATVRALAVQPDGKVLVGGSFSQVGGRSQRGLVRLNADGTLDTSFADPQINSLVRAIAVQGDGKIVIGGLFTSVAGQVRNRIARLNVDGTLDTGFNPNADGWVHAIALQGDGKVVFAGTFNNVSTSGRTKVARVHANGDVDGTFTPNITGLTGFAVNAVAVQSNGKIVIGGDFLQADGVNQRRVARLQSDGSRDSSFADPVIVGTIHSLYVRSDERVIVAGEFVSVNSEPRLGMARLRATGIVDTAFPNPLVRALATSNTSSGLYAVAPIRDGLSVIGGRIFSVQGEARTGVAALFG